MYNIKKITLAFLLLISTASCQDQRTVKVTVTEEDGTPIHGAEVLISFVAQKSSQSTRSRGLTNAKGEFQATDKVILRMQARINKEGYYETFSGRLSRKANHDLTYILRKKKNSIALYAKRISLKFPVNKEWLGFDFEAGDWVVPHGKGTTTDAFFKCNTKKTGWAEGNGSMQIKFGEEEGLCLEQVDYLPISEMKLPHEAPKEGYVNHFERSEESYHNKNARDGVGLFFRTRVKIENKSVVSAHYGKLAGDIHFSPRESGWHVSHKGKPKSFATASFTYYFNPVPNDRNLEFDPKKNLFTDLKNEEQVREP